MSCTEEYTPLPGEGDTRTEVRKRRGCEVCGEAATKCCTYLLEGYRTNPASNAYHKDDCSWCSDAKAFACDAHADIVRRDAPAGMVDGSMFSLPRFAHMLLHWAPQA